MSANRKALIIGVDFYRKIVGLRGCVNDAYSMNAVLERNADGTVNFPTPNLLVATGPSQDITKRQAKDAIRELFADDSEIALLYFAGHGFLDDTGGFICLSDSEDGDDGLSLFEIMQFANASPARNRVVILDSCHSGAVGRSAANVAVSEVSDGVTVQTACTANQSAEESGNGSSSGVFTDLLVDALNGAAANLVGSVTPGSAYAHIDQSLGPWAQRPVFKTNVKTFVSLREASPPISLSDLQQLVQIFPTPEHVYRLDPSFEPERNGTEGEGVPAPDPVNNAVFKVLQKYVAVNLVRPVGAPHMWHAAMESESCELTVLGQHYWALVKKGLI